jgi:hypothetical protein
MTCFECYQLAEKIAMKRLWLGIFFLVLSGCVEQAAYTEPTVFDVPQSQWSQLTHAQQNQVIAAYNLRQQTAVENAPLQNVISTAGALVQESQAE